MDTTKFKPAMDNFNPEIRMGTLPMFLWAVPFNVDATLMASILGGKRLIFDTVIAVPSKADYQPQAYSHT